MQTDIPEATQTAGAGDLLAAMGRQISAEEVVLPAGPMDYKIACRAAEMLAMPYRVCGQRRCRRLNKCNFYYDANRFPRCMDNLTPAMAIDYLALYNLALQIATDSAGPQMLQPSDDPDLRALQETAVAIVRDTIRDPLRKKRFDAFCRHVGDPDG
jgi:hypothetical protein